MSDNDMDTGSKSTEKALFSEKEEAVLKAAWSCLKTPPEIDFEKLQAAGDFNTMKTTQNTWGKIKKKLATFSDGEAPPSTPKQQTPKPKKKGTATATPKKRGKYDANDDDEDGDVFQSAKKPRRTPVKKEKADDEEDDDQF